MSYRLSFDKPRNTGDNLKEKRAIPHSDYKTS